MNTDPSPATASERAASPKASEPTAEQRSASPKKPEDDTGGGEAKGLVELHTHHNSCPRGEHCACYVTGYTDAEYDHGHVFESLDDKLTVVEKKTLSHRPTPVTASDQIAASRAAHASDDLDVELDALEYHVKNKQTTFALTTIKSLRRLVQQDVRERV